jgi:hypothetical protein
MEVIEFLIEGVYRENVMVNAVGDQPGRRTSPL